MSKKKRKAVPTNPPKQEKKMVINMTKVELAKAYHVPGIRTGRHMTEKDRPRKKNWKREYERGRDREHISKDMDPVLLFFYITREYPFLISILPCRCSSRIRSMAVSITQKMS